MSALITNVRDAVQIGVCSDGVSPVLAGASICCTCKKEMPKCWDTVCYGCGDTSCYQHSWITEPPGIVGGYRVKDAPTNYWYCEKCRPVTATQRHLRPA
jgi:hypothetical protein